MPSRHPQLPLLSVGRTGELRLGRHPEGRALHVSAASGMVLVGGRTWVVADDELHVAMFDGDPSRTEGEMVRVLPGRLPDPPKPRKAAKPDLEALVPLPAGPGTWTLLGVPSGSKPHRILGFALGLDADGAASGQPRATDFTEVMRALAARTGARVNVEGAAVVGDELHLFNRGNGTNGANFVARLDLALVLEAITAGTPLPASSLREVDRLHLGAIDGVPLTVTDAAPLGTRVVFTAAAERTDDAYADGAVAGSAIGILAPDGRVERAWRLDLGQQKVEAVIVLPKIPGDPVGSVRVRLATDDDDPGRPASVFEAVLPPG